MWPARRDPGRGDPPARPWAPGQWAAVALLTVGGAVAGAAGVAVFAVALGAQWMLRDRQRWRDGVTIGASAGGLILAGAMLSRHPWRSVDGYAGHSAGVQLLALVSLAVLAASVVLLRREPFRRRRRA
ncbi:hypothetical protein A5707_13000 [Mycobacterium kyorinense]|uniref:Uncharacterized protein n=1 Tax=Mycobacterium kyorinense TaxID=487514 RepID=A0A1A2ZQC5_9MYCO|nr:hypothetical protein A5707_13000 [Mycobacterium kyorinense]